MRLVNPVFDYSHYFRKPNDATKEDMQNLIIKLNQIEELKAESKRLREQFDKIKCINPNRRISRIIYTMA